MVDRESRIREKPVKASILLLQLREDIRALNSAISIISQKMRHLTRNEKILGRNLIVLNKKVKELAEMREKQALPPSVEKRFKEIEKRLDDIEKRIEELNMIIVHLRKEFVTYDEMKEIRQIIDSINPLELATIDQVKELIEKSKRTDQPTL